MAGELRAAQSPGLTVYAHILDSIGRRWNGTAFETYNASNYADYDISLTEQGSSGIYIGDFPTGITSSGTYEYVVYIQAGGSPAEGDQISNTGTVDWTGTTTAAATAGSMTGPDFLAYVIRRGFKRTDKDTELYEAMTDAVQIMRRRFRFEEAEVETNSTDTISVDGDYEIAIESDMGLLVGVTLLDDENAHNLLVITKKQFDSIYPDISVTNDRGYPKHVTIFNGNLQIGPIPDRTDYQYRLAYSSRAGTVSLATSGVPFTNLYRDVLADLVLARAYHDLEEFAQSDRFYGRFEQGFAEAVHRERINRGEGTFAVRYRDF